MPPSFLKHNRRPVLNRMVDNGLCCSVEKGNCCGGSGSKQRQQQQRLDITTFRVLKSLNFRRSNLKSSGHTHNTIPCPRFHVRLSCDLICVPETLPRALCSPKRRCKWPRPRAPQPAPATIMIIRITYIQKQAPLLCQESHARCLATSLPIKSSLPLPPPPPSSKNPISTLPSPTILPRFSTPTRRPLASWRCNTA